MILLRKFIDYKRVSFDDTRYRNPKILHYKNIVTTNSINFSRIIIKTKLCYGHVKCRNLFFSKRPIYPIEIYEHFYEDDKKYNLFSFAYEPKSLKEILAYFIDYYAEPYKISSYAICSKKINWNYGLTKKENID